MPMSINGPREARLLQPNSGEMLTGMGVTMNFKTIGAQSNGQFLVLEYTAPPHLGGPPPHWHSATTEIFYVLEGELSLLAGDTEQELGAGGCAYIPPGVVHTFANPGSAPAKYLLIASPAGLEDYFAELAVLIKEEVTWPPEDMNKVVELMAKYDTFAPDRAAPDSVVGAGLRNASS